MPGLEEEREEAGRQRGASNHVSSGTTGRWAEIPRRCAPFAAVSEPGFFSSFPFSSFSFTPKSPGDLSRAPLNSASIRSTPGPTQRSAQWGGSRTTFVWVEGREV